MRIYFRMSARVVTEIKYKNDQTLNDNNNERLKRKQNKKFFLALPINTGANTAKYYRDGGGRCCL